MGDVPLSHRDDLGPFDRRVDPNRIIHGAGPDTPIETNSEGGSQSAIPYRFDLIDGQAMSAMANVLHTGAEKYGENNWRKIPVEDHLNHLIMHAYAYLAGDTQDDHLSHIMCRAMFATGVAFEQPNRKSTSDYLREALS